jgi:hypothetical protein
VAEPPKRVTAITRSPTCTAAVPRVPVDVDAEVVVSGVTASTTPANSRPGTKIPLGVALYRPRMAKMSAKFRPTACTWVGWEVEVEVEVDGYIGGGRAENEGCTRMGTRR